MGADPNAGDMARGIPTALALARRGKLPCVEFSAHVRSKQNFISDCRCKSCPPQSHGGAHAAIYRSFLKSCCDAVVDSAWRANTANICQDYARAAAATAAMPLTDADKARASRRQ